MTIMAMYQRISTQDGYVTQGYDFQYGIPIYSRHRHDLKLKSYNDIQSVEECSCGMVVTRRLA